MVKKSQYGTSLSCIHYKLWILCSPTTFVTFASLNMNYLIIIVTSVNGFLLLLNHHDNPLCWWPHEPAIFKSQNAALFIHRDGLFGYNIAQYKFALEKKIYFTRENLCIVRHVATAGHGENLRCRNQGKVLELHACLVYQC